MRQTRLSHQFVEFIPEKLEEGVLYVSKRYSTAAHKCCCGCGEEVFTPLTPTDWSLRIDGDYLTLNPSIGNWSYACRSHYWIRKSQVIWAGQMSQRQIERTRAIRRNTKQAFFKAAKSNDFSNLKQPANEPLVKNDTCGLLDSFLRALKQWWTSFKK